MKNFWQYIQIRLPFINNFNLYNNLLYIFLKLACISKKSLIFICQQIFYYINLFYNFYLFLYSDLRASLIYIKPNLQLFKYRLN